jgi:hypothetical protein
MHLFTSLDMLLLGLRRNTRVTILGHGNYVCGVTLEIIFLSSQTEVTFKIIIGYGMEHY